jgi:hypothetical protein
MDALDRRNRSRFERHLACCQECTAEVGGLREATARLAAAAAAQPPAALKQRLLAQTARTRQLPPLAGEVTGGHGREQRGPAGVPRSRWASRWRSGGHRGWTAAPGWVGAQGRLGAALGLSVVLLLAAGAFWLTAGTSGQGQRPGRSTEVAAVLTAPDATVLTSRVRTGGSATVVMSHRERMLVFAAAGLRALPASRCYELWLVGPGGDSPAGLLPMPSHGMTGPVVAAGLGPAERLGLTVEPAAGSKQPTSAMIMELPL